jgi:hypothetical protein
MADADCLENDLLDATFMAIAYRRQPQPRIPSQSNDKKLAYHVKDHFC